MKPSFRIGPTLLPTISVVVIEIEVDDLPISIDRQTSDVVTKIAVPINSKPIGATRHITAIARYRLRQLRRISLLRPERIAPSRPMLVAIPKPNDQLHKEMAIDPMPFASGGISKIRRIFPQIDLYDLIERLVPKLDERVLDVESGRYLLVGLCQCRRHFGCRDGSSRANRPCGPHDETAPIDLLVSAHVCLQQEILKRSCYVSRRVANPYVLVRLQHVALVGFATAHHALLCGRRYSMTRFSPV